MCCHPVISDFTSIGKCQTPGMFEEYRHAVKQRTCSLISKLFPCCDMLLGGWVEGDRVTGNSVE